MATQEHLDNAPITEALIDFRVMLSDDFQVDKLASLHDLISDHYPDQTIIQRLEAKIEFKKGETPKSKGTGKPFGYRYTSTDKTQIVQARADGFTFSRLKPYIDWKQLREEASRLWNLYVDITSPELITRVALRYINNLNIPLPIKDLSDHLTAPPIIPKELPQGIVSFLSRVVIHEPSIDANAIITQALEQLVKPDVAPIILDIDVFKSAPNGIKNDLAWDTIEELRKLKNDIFFKSITEPLKELYL